MMPSEEGKEFQEGVDEGNVEETVRVDEKMAMELKKTKLGGDGKDPEKPPCWEHCDFERAISATGYGRYNVMILGASIFPMLSCVFATSTMSLILPSAGCDLNLTNFHKGILNASTYIGMICSAFFWGFLSDTLGRQKLLVISFALDAVLNLTAGLSQSFTVLLASKLLAGFICSGPYAILMTYLAECHSAEHRAAIIQWTGVFSALATVSLPLLAWAIIPQKWMLDIVGLYLPSWRIFLIVCSIPAVVSATTFYFQHESPKFLMTQGRNEEAMAAFQTIYAINSRKPKSSFPVISLINEKKKSETEEKSEKSLMEEEHKSALRFLHQGWLQVKPLFLPPHLLYAVLAFLFQGCSLFGLNTLRLWMPQLFSSILANEQLAKNATSVCELLVEKVADNVTTVCESNVVDAQVYVNSIIIGIITAISYLVSGYLIKAMGKKWLIIGCTWLSVLCCCCMYWATSSNAMLAMSSIVVSFASVSSTAIISVVVDLFPTTLRTMAVSLTMMFGRMGAMTGNLIFPLLLDWNCTVPFFLLAFVLFCASIIMFAIPKTKGKALE